jgi:hypothetical protein
MKLVLVKWLDAQDHPDKWVDVKDAEEFGQADCEIISVGFLVSRTGKYITLAGDYDAVDQDYGRVTKIPSSMVTSVEEINQETKS